MNLKVKFYLKMEETNESILSLRKAIALKPDEKSFNLFLAKSLYHSKKENFFQNQ